MTLLPLVVAAIELVAPAPNENLVLLPECQRAVITNATREIRQEVLKRLGKKATDWRKSNDVTFSWRATAGEKGPWEFAIGKDPELASARVEYTKTEPDAKGVVRFTLPLPNFEIGTRYYWRVSCGKESAAGTFVTDALAPRWITIEGRVKNFRDLGGRRTADGRLVRQGLVYRSQGLNDNSVTGKKRGRNRLMVEDREYLTQTLGIKTDIDLRSSRETADMTASPLGDSVKFVHLSACAYAGIFTPEGKKTMAKVFRVFCDPANYPILFHCIAGADRTGAVAYVLNGVLGVSRPEIEADWESTFYPVIPYKDKAGNLVWNSEEHFNQGFGKYGQEGDTWNRRVELYLQDCGITPEEIEKFRSIMLK